MARSQKSPLAGGRRYTVNQSGAPESATDENTVWIGKQPDEDAAPKSKSKSD